MDFTIRNGELIEYKGNAHHVIVPDGVARIKDQVFQRCLSVESVVLPEGLISIGNEAFYFCVALSSVTIPDSVAHIGDCAFCGCKGLTNIDIPNGVTAIEKRTFEGCMSLEKVVVPEQVTKIGEAAFRWCKNLNKVTIKSNSISIGDWAFEGCSEFELVVPDGSSIQIGKDTFLNVPSIMLDTYINDIEKQGSFRKLIIKTEPLNKIRRKSVKELAVKGFLAAKDTSVYGDKELQSYLNYLKGNMKDYIDFVLEDDTDYIVSKLCSLKLLNNEVYDELWRRELPFASKAVLLEYRKKIPDGEKVENELEI